MCKTIGRIEFKWLFHARFLDQVVCSRVSCLFRNIKKYKSVKSCFRTSSVCRKIPVLLKTRLECLKICNNRHQSRCSVRLIKNIFFAIQQYLLFSKTVIERVQSLYIILSRINEKNVFFKYIPTTDI